MPITYHNNEKGEITKISSVEVGFGYDFQPLIDANELINILMLNKTITSIELVNIEIADADQSRILDALASLPNLRNAILSIRPTRDAANSLFKLIKKDSLKTFRVDINEGTSQEVSNAILAAIKISKFDYIDLGCGSPSLDFSKLYIECFNSPNVRKVVSNYKYSAHADQSILRREVIGAIINIPREKFLQYINNPQEILDIKIFIQSDNKGLSTSMFTYFPWNGANDLGYDNNWTCLGSARGLKDVADEFRTQLNEALIVRYQKVIKFKEAAKYFMVLKYNTPHHNIDEKMYQYELKTSKMGAKSTGKLMDPKASEEIEIAKNRLLAIELASKLPPELTMRITNLVSGIDPDIQIRSDWIKGICATSIQAMWRGYRTRKALRDQSAIPVSSDSHEISRFCPVYY